MTASVQVVAPGAAISARAIRGAEQRGSPGVSLRALPSVNDRVLGKRIRWLARARRPRPPQALAMIGSTGRQSELGAVGAGRALRGPTA